MDVFELFAKLTLDTSRYDEGLANASGLAINAGKQIMSAFVDVGEAIFGVAKQAVDSYSNYQQLAGGVETLFKDASGVVMENASKAFATAGMSANEYMETVTSFSASLIQSTGRGAQQDLEALEENLDKQYKETKRHWEDKIALVKDSAEKTSLKRQMEDDLEMLKKHNKEVLAQAEASNMQSISTTESLERAAKLADQAIIDMSDNANKMGTDMASIQNAYQGFAKQNYTMLDNLKLGYGGTKAEMERLLQDAERLAGVKFDISSYADIVEAIHVVQTELGITNTTAEEAAGTIQGSMKALEAAWKDLLTSIAGGGIEMNQAIDNLVNTAEAFLENTIPIFEKALYGIGNLIQGIAPLVAERLPDLLATLVPMLVETAIYIVNSLVEALPQFVDTIGQALIDILPMLVETIVNLLDSLLTNIIPTLFEVAIQIILALGQGLADNLPQITDSVVQLLLFIIATIIEHLPEIIMVGLDIINGLVTGLLQNLNLITDSVVILIKTMVMTIIEHLPDILAAAIEIGAKIVAGIVLAIPSLIVSVGRMLGIVDEAKERVSDRAFSMQNDVSTSTSNISSELDNMISNLNRKTNQARDEFSSTSDIASSTQDNMNAKATDMVKTAHTTEKEVQIFANNIVNIVGLARASLQTIYENITNIFDGMKLKMEEVGRIVVKPIVDPSGVQAGCAAIVDAVNQALEALRALNSANSGGGGNFGGGHASGGWMEAGTTYLVGELGPELVTPTRSGYVHTADETASMLGGRGDIHITIQGDVYDDEFSFRRKLRNAVVAVIDEEMSYA